MRNIYSVPPRLRGERLLVRLSDLHVEVLYGGKPQLLLERVRGEGKHHLTRPGSWCQDFGTVTRGTPTEAAPGPAYSRRERQLMDIVYRLGEATAVEIHRELPDPPTYTAVRGLLRVLVDKGHLAVERDGPRYVYRPRTSRDAAGASLLAHVVRTFFDGSAAKAMDALVGSAELRLTREEIERLARIVDEAREGEGGA